MIGSVGRTAMYMPSMQTSQVQQEQGPGSKDGFQIIDSDSSGGVTSSELEILSSKLTEAGGSAIDIESSMTTYDLDGDEQLSGEELFTLLSESGLTPIPSAGETSGPMSSDSNGGMKPPPPPPPPPSTSMSQGISAYASESESDEEIYAQLIEQLTGGYQSNGVSESLLNEMA